VLSGDVLADRFQVLELIDRGTIATVWRGIDVRSYSPIAVKILLPGCDDGMRATFAGASEALAAIVHPNLISIRAAGEYKGAPYFVMPLLDGETLTSAIRSRGRFPPAVVARIGLHLCNALARVHAHGHLHRDAKPSNVILDIGGDVVLLDFAVERDLGDSVVQPHLIAGSPAYMAPEHPHCADARSDLYTLGITLYEMATGELPFRARTVRDLIIKHYCEPAPHANALVPDLPDALDDLIAQALEKNPADRFQNAVQMSEGLEELDRWSYSSIVTSGPPHAELSSPAGALPRFGSGPMTAIAEPTTGRRWAWFQRFMRFPRLAKLPRFRVEPKGAKAIGLGILAATVIGIAVHSSRPPSTPAEAAPPAAVEQPTSCTALPELGTLQITSVPAGAKVLANGVAIGETPFKGRFLPAGSYDLALELKDHRPWRTRTTLEVGRLTSLVAKLDPLPALLQVIPRFGEGAARATIFIDGRPLERTESLCRMLAPGRYEVRVGRGRVRSEPVVVRLKPGETRRVTIRLPRSGMSARVSSDGW
jgi:hypothetical protein